MKKRIAVIGLGAFGTNVATSLTQQGAEVIAIDPSREKIEDIKDQCAFALALDATDPAALRAAEIDRMDCVIIAIPDDLEEKVLILSALQEIGVKEVHVRINTRRERSIFSRLGASSTIFPSEEAGAAMARRLTIGTVSDADPVDENYSVAKIAVPAFLNNKTILELRLREKHHLNLVTILQLPQQGDTRLPCRGVLSPEDTVHTKETLILFGKDEHLREFVRFCNAE